MKAAVRVQFTLAASKVKESKVAEKRSCIETNTLNRHNLRTSHIFRLYHRPATRLNSTAFEFPPSTNFEKDNDEFLKWRNENNIKTPNIEIKFFDNVRGTTSVKDIQSGECLVQLPRSACISVSASEDCPFPEKVSTEYWSSLVGDEQQGLIRLALVLLNEKSKGKDSQYYEYIKQLPKDIPVLHSFSPKMRKELQYPALFDEIDKAGSEESAVVKRVVKEMKGAKPEDVKWAMRVVKSRVFSGQLDPKVKSRLIPRAMAVAAATAAFLSSQSDAGRWLSVTAMAWLLASDTLAKRRAAKAAAEGRGGGDTQETFFLLMPMIDAINHQGGEKTEFQYSALTDKFEVVADKAFKQGEEAFISYGELANDELAMRYGFVLPNNREDYFVIADLLAWLRTHCPPVQALTTKQLARLREQGLLEALEQVRVLRSGAVDTGVLKSLDALLAEANQQTPEEPDVDLGSLLPEVVSGALADMSTTLEEDKRMLEGEEVQDMDPQRRLAIEFRIQKKELLTSALSFINK